ncbi:MAG: hypothetical protein SFX73_11770 [Kofleriaceae bacterium]|nr:hypothetical protein [Kofleriaceae bacterium]
MVTRPLIAALLLGLVACAQSGGEGDDEQQVTPEEEDNDQPAGPGGSSQCDEGFHACGQTCLADSATNDKPELGCALGCGQPCPTPENGVAICTDDGICGFECDEGFARVGSNCVASVCDEMSYGCGTYTDDEGTNFNCGTCAENATCGANHQCIVSADAMEPNNGAAQATTLGTFNDFDDPTKWVENLTIHTPTDEDWFTFHVDDGWDGGNPDINVQLTKRNDSLGWLESPHEITVWWKCDSADAGSKVSCGEWSTPKSENTLNDAVLGKGCKIETEYLPWGDISTACNGLTDSGTVTVRVKRTAPPLGDDYDLFVSID